MKIAAPGTGYVGLSIAALLSQRNSVTAVDVIPEKVEKINNRISPIQDEYIEKYLAEKDLDLTAIIAQLEASCYLKAMAELSLERTSGDNTESSVNYIHKQDAGYKNQPRA